MKQFLKDLKERWYIALMGFVFTIVALYIIF